MFKTGYEIFVSHPAELAIGKELKLEVRNCENYRTKVIRALVFPPEEESAEGEALWVRGTIGYLISEKPWSIKIIEVLGER